MALQYACMVGPRSLIYVELSTSGSVAPSSRFNQGETGSSATRLVVPSDVIYASQITFFGLEGRVPIILGSIVWICGHSTEWRHCQM